MPRFVGRATITVDGVELLSMPGATIDIGGVKRNPIVTDAGVVGHAAEPVPARVECQLSMDKDTRLAAQRDWEDVTVSFACDTGQRYVIASAFSENPPKVTAKDGGQIPVALVGPAAVENA
jgi:hypothetical protein